MHQLLLCLVQQHTALNRENLICCQPCLSREIFLLKTEAIPALPHSLTNSLVNHSAYLHLFYNAYDNYMG